MVQLSQLYLTIEKTIAFTIQTFVGRVMSLLFNTLSRFVISFPAKKQMSSDFMAAVTIRSDFRAQEGGKVEVVTDSLFLGPKITADGDCNHEIRRRLLLGRKAMTNLDGVL